MAKCQGCGAESGHRPACVDCKSKLIEQAESERMWFPTTARIGFKVEQNRDRRARRG